MKTGSVIFHLNVACMLLAGIRENGLRAICRTRQQTIILPLNVFVELPVIFSEGVFQLAFEYVNLCSVETGYNKKYVVVTAKGSLTDGSLGYTQSWGNFFQNLLPILEA